MTDLKRKPNPFDFANPITNSDYFAGRDDELDEIDYYLDLASTTEMPINLALLGERASGKTSLLNVIERKASERGFLVGRIELDESDAESELNFFYKAFDALLFPVVSSGKFGGTEGKTFQAYLEMTTTFEVPADRVFCPFLFPIQFAHAKRSGQTNFSDQNLRHDLKKLQQEAGSPLVLLIDEGNILAKSRVLLQKIRNTFMNLQGFMVILTGTPEIFPVMDHVFSPIARQFKKIKVEPFSEWKDTKECVQKPLKAIGLDASELIHGLDILFYKEIHEISGGRPYEIQLVCHMMFRRLQFKRTMKMKVDISALEDVRIELEATQDISIRPSINALRKLKNQELKILGYFLAWVGGGKTDQIWELAFILKDRPEMSRDEFDNWCKRFVDDGILIRKGEHIVFNGDDFDHIYAKYYARSHKVRFIFSESPTWVVVHREIFLFKTIPPKQRLNIIGVPLNMPQVREKLVDPCIHDFGGIADSCDVSVNFQEVAKRLYHMHYRHQNSRDIDVLYVNLHLGWFDGQIFYYSDPASEGLLYDELIKNLEEIQRRVKKLNGELNFRQTTVPTVPLKKLRSIVAGSPDILFRHSLGEWHGIAARDSYLKEGNTDNSLEKALLAYEYGLDTSENWNNNGYILLSSGKFVEAKECFIKATKADDYEHGEALPIYNLGITEFAMNNAEKALEMMNNAQTLLDSKKPDDKYVRLNRIVKRGDDYRLEEELEVDIVKFTDENIAALKNITKES